VARRGAHPRADADVDVAFFPVINAGAGFCAEPAGSGSALADGSAPRTAPGVDDRLVKAQGPAGGAGGVPAHPERDTLLEQLAQAPDSETPSCYWTVGALWLDYPFFQALTPRSRRPALQVIRPRRSVWVELFPGREILALLRKLDTATKAMFEAASTLLREIRSAEPRSGRSGALPKLDENFFSVLDMNVQSRSNRGNKRLSTVCRPVAEAVSRAIAAAQPPEVRFVTAAAGVAVSGRNAQAAGSQPQGADPQLWTGMRTWPRACGRWPAPMQPTTAQDH